jgi:hypothetical protein
MRTVGRKFLSRSAVSISAAVLSLMVVLGAPSGASADEADAKSRLKAMSDYMAAQKAISFGFDATLEVVTKDAQKRHCQSKFVYFAKTSEPDFAAIDFLAFSRVDLSGSMAAPSI